MKFSHKMGKQKAEKKKRLICRWEYVCNYYDPETGEKVENPTEEQIQDAEDEDGDDNKSASPQFFKGFSTLVEFLQPGSHLSKNSYQLMLYFLIYSGYKNKLYYSRNAIAKATGIKPTAISRAFNELLKVGFCLKLNTSGFCLLNPYFSFRGTDPQPIQRWFNKEQDEQSRLRMKTAMSKTPPSSKNKKENTDEKKRKKPKPTNDLKSQIAKSDAKAKILEYLLSKKDQNDDVFKQVKELVDELNLSKVTIIQFLTTLQADGYISRPARGHIKLLRVNDLKRLLR